ncbi:MAG: radical SAM protein [Alphaproteobacteria bacterium]|nr:MAG: radical SAM protein [Alphaproteobacteria bacterium]
MKSINELIQKYNRPGPRYTSYPPVPFWNKPPSESEWIENIKNNYQKEVGVDLYVHVPYCESLCYYCGCNRTITKNHDVEDFYLSALLTEWAIYKERLGLDLSINSLHFGGGTPTFLSPLNLEKLITTLLVNKSNTFIGSIEIDPRTCRDEHLEVLARCGIKRVSLGIQDFDPIVQKAINRDQSPAMVETLVEKLRLGNFSSINFDLIYGLPK